MENLSALAVFVQVAESRSLVAAGRLLGVSASAVGKSVTRLEQRLGVRLFHRSTRSVTLTAEGTLLLQRSRRILAELDAVEQELAQTRAAARGRLRVSLPVLGSPLLPVLAEFARQYPEIELDLDFSDRLVDVIEEGFDAVVRTGVPADSRLSARPLGRFRMRLVASPEYLARHGTPRAPTELAGHRCLHYRFSHSGKLEKWALRDDTDTAEYRLPVAMVCNTIEARVCFALQGLGIAYLPDFAVAAPLADGRLCSILTDHLLSDGVFHVLWPASRHPSPKLRALVDFLGARMFPQWERAAPTP